MDWSQLLFFALIFAATLTGDKRIAAVMWMNFTATVALAGNPVTVAGADALAAALLLSCGRRGQIVAAVYAIMIPIYPFAAWAGLPSYATYTIIDLLAFIQLAAMGGWDRGVGIARRFVSGRSSVILGSVEARDNASGGVGLHPAKGLRR